MSIVGLYKLSGSQYFFTQNLRKPNVTASTKGALEFRSIPQPMTPFDAISDVPLVHSEGEDTKENKVVKIKDHETHKIHSPLFISMISSWARGQSPPMPPEPITPPSTLPRSLCGDAVAIARASGLQ